MAKNLNSKEQYAYDILKKNKGSMEFTDKEQNYVKRAGFLRLYDRGLINYTVNPVTLLRSAVMKPNFDELLEGQTKKEEPKVKKEKSDKKAKAREERIAKDVAHTEAVKAKKAARDAETSSTGYIPKPGKKGKQAIPGGVVVGKVAQAKSFIG